MKKVLLSAFALSAILANAQNMATSTKKGFSYKFDGTKAENCMPASNLEGVITYPTATNSNYGDRFGTGKTGLTADLNTTNSTDGALRFAFGSDYDASFPGNVAEIRFLGASCEYAGTTLDLSMDSSFTLEITTSRDVTLAAIVLGSGASSGWADLNAPTKEFKAGVKTTWTANFPASQWNKKPAKINAAIAWGLQVLGETASAVNIDVYSAKIGDANITSTTESNVNAEVISTKFFNINGTEVSNSSNGLLIVEETLSNGSVRRTKKMVN